jgi:galactose mutarotase-like enzyme
VIHAGNFGGHWLSDTDLSFSIALTGEAVEAAVTAKNVGRELEPMAIGWHPYFAIPSGDRAQARLHVPAAMMAVANDAIPTGQLKPVKGTEYDYLSPSGVPVDDHALDTNFSHFTRTDGAIDVRLMDPESNYGIRVEGLSPEIRTVQVYSPQGKSFVAIEDQFNYADPFGKQWKGMDTGMVTLRPGQSVTWKVRLALFTPGGTK